MREERLKAKVKAVNKANEYAAILHPVLTEKFTPFVGKLIEKVDGNLLAKVEKLLPQFPNTVGLRVYRHKSHYSLAWTIQACENVGVGDTCTCTYYETTVYIGEMDVGVLTKLTPPLNYHTNYTVKEVVAKRQAYADAKKIADAAKDALHPFGEYDN